MKTDYDKLADMANSLTSSDLEQLNRGANAAFSTKSLLDAMSKVLSKPLISDEVAEKSSWSVDNAADIIMHDNEITRMSDNLDIPVLSELEINLHKKAIGKCYAKTVGITGEEFDAALDKTVASGTAFVKRILEPVQLEGIQGHPTLELKSNQCKIKNTVPIEVKVSYMDNIRNETICVDIMRSYMDNISNVIKQSSLHSLSEGVKYDSDKLDWNLLPLDSIDDILKVLMFGSKKYAPDNWKKVQDANNRYYAAAMRHLSAWRRGELNDSETGISHLSHAGCCLLFLISLELNNVK